MDIQMPILDGLQATQAIRDKGFTTIPIIAVSAHALKEERQKAKDVGMNDYITKPLKRKEVFDILEKWVFYRSTLQVN